MQWVPWTWPRLQAAALWDPGDVRSWALASSARVVGAHPKTCPALTSGSPLAPSYLAVEVYEDDVTTPYQAPISPRLPDAPCKSSSTRSLVDPQAASPAVRSLAASFNMTSLTR